MFRLIRNEWMKIWKRPATLVMVLLLCLVVTIVGAFSKFQDSGLTVPDNENWQRGLELENKGYEDQLKDESLSKETTDYLQKEIAINDYRIQNNISTNIDYSVWDFVEDGSQLISVAGLFIIIVAAGLVANEFHWGTVKLLLIRPISRTKILLSKYMTVLLFGIFMLFTLFAFSFVLGIFLFGFPDIAYPYLIYQEGEVYEQSMLLHSVIQYGLSSISIFMLITMAFMISTVFRNSSLSIGISIFLMFMGNTVTYFLASRFEWAKYILFANTDLTQYTEGSPLIPGMTLPFSIGVLSIYLIVFLVLSFLVFKKRDVAS